MGLDEKRKATPNPQFFSDRSGQVGQKHEPQAYGASFFAMKPRIAAGMRVYYFPLFSDAIKKVCFQRDPKGMILC